MADTRSRRWLRIGLIVLAVLVLVPVAGLTLFAVTFDPNSYKPQIADAVKRATGRDLALAGPIALRLGLRPSIEARDVSLANIEGGSRPQMAKLDRLEAQVALLPLVHRQIEIDRLVLVRPDILLETDAQGRPNWQFGPAVPSQTLPQPETASPSKAPPPEIALRDVRIEDGILTYRDGKTGRSKVLALQHLDAHAASAESPVKVAMQARYDDAPFTVDGEVGPLFRLLAPDSPTPWPMRLALASAGAKVNVAGALTQPLQGRGYNLKLDGAVPDLAALQPFYPRAILPPVHDLSFAAQIADSGGRIPDVSALTVHAGASDLSGLVPGLSLTKLDLAAPRMDQPVRANLDGRFGTAPLAVAATLGAPASLVPGGPVAGPFPVDVSVEAAGSKVSAKGGIADPAHWSGLDIALSAQVPDLAALSPLAGRPLPALKNVAFQTRAGERDGSLAKGVVLRDLKLTLPQGDLAGTATLGFGGHPSVQAVLSAGRIDADGLEAALAASRTPPGQAGPGAAIPDAPAVPPATPPRPPLPHAAKSVWVIPDEPLPFDMLRRADADMQTKIGALISGGVTYRDIAFHLLLQGGKLRVDPFTAQLPAGAMDLKLTADANEAAPPVSLGLHAPGLALRPLLAALGLPQGASGVAEVELDLHGAGRTPHALAAGLNGHAGVAMVNGQIENRLIAATIGEALRQANLPPIAAVNGASAVRCFAARFDAVHGVAGLRAFLLDSTLVHVDGTGTVNLADETLALRIEPLARMGGTGVMVPLRVGGTLRNPKATVDAAGAAGEALRLAEGASGKNGQLLGVVIGALGADRMIAGAGRDTCQEQLAIARGGRAGPVPAAAPASPAPAANTGAGKPKPPNPTDLLRQFLR